MTTTNGGVDVNVDVGAAVVGIAVPVLSHMSAAVVVGVVRTVLA